MDKSRRNFIGYMSILGVVGLSGLPVYAKPAGNTSFTPIDDGIDRSDASFDPDGWL